MAEASVDAKKKPEDLVLTRVLDAPRRLVFEAFTKKEHLEKWFFPNGFSMPKCEVDARPGGRLDYTMHGFGKDFPVRGEYREVVQDEKLVFVSDIHDGNLVVTTVLFEEAGGKTKLTVRQSFTFESFATRGAPQGWAETLEHLRQFLAAS